MEICFEQDAHVIAKMAGRNLAKGCKTLNLILIPINLHFATQVYWCRAVRSWSIMCVGVGGRHMSKGELPSMMYKASRTVLLALNMRRKIQQNVKTSTSVIGKEKNQVDRGVPCFALGDVPSSSH